MITVGKCGGEVYDDGLGFFLGGTSVHFHANFCKVVISQGGSLFDILTGSEEEGRVVSVQDAEKPQ